MIKEKQWQKNPSKEDKKMTNKDAEMEKDCNKW